VKLAITGPLVLLFVASASAQKLTVKVLNRQDNETDYSYVVPGSFSSQANSNVNCYGSDTNVNCNGSPSKRVDPTVRKSLSRIA
jgi:hypothetical protein